MILLDALYINNSGGRVLLNHLISSLETAKKNVFYLLDDRVKGGFDFLPDEKVQYLAASLIKRHGFYKKNADRFSSVLCFGNIPPTLSLSIPVFTYFQNTVYFYTTQSFSPRHRLLLGVKAKVIKALRRNTTEWWVQTNEVQQLFAKYWHISNDKVRLYPFFEMQVPVWDKQIAKVPQSFLYVSDGHPNKMHSVLLQAFRMLSSTFPNATLHLTISSQYPMLLSSIETMQQEGLGVKNLGWCTKEMLAKQYQQNEFLIYPSTMESFGLGLIEAAQYQMKILAADMPYTKAVINPSAVFNPNDAAAIAACMQHALQHSLVPATLNIQSAIGAMMDRLN